MFEINNSDTGFYSEIKLDGEYLCGINEDYPMRKHEVESLIMNIAHRLGMKVEYGKVED